MLIMSISLGRWAILRAHWSGYPIQQRGAPRGLSDDDIKWLEITGIENLSPEVLGMKRDSQQHLRALLEIGERKGFGFDLLDNRFPIE